MSDYSEFYLKAPASVVELELVEISHPNFSQTYRLVRNAVDGVDVTLEDASEESFIYMPMRIQNSGFRTDIDQGLRIDFGDVGEILTQEIDSVRTGNGFGTYPVLKYRTYRSDVLTAPLSGPLVLDVVEATFNQDGAFIVAAAPQANILRTGVVYSLPRFDGLRDLL